MKSDPDPVDASLGCILGRDTGKTSFGKPFSKRSTCILNHSSKAVIKSSNITTKAKWVDEWGGSKRKNGSPDPRQSEELIGVDQPRAA